MPGLRQCWRLVYAGKGLSLDLHTSSDYEAVHACDVATASGAHAFVALCRRADAVLSSCDMEVARLAVDAGRPTALYDPLSWFYRQMPAVCGEVELYLCQNFLGVKERLAADPARRAVVVPPLVPSLPSMPRRGTLVNLGGLRHPFTDDAACAAYGRAMVAAVHGSRSAAPLSIFTSGRVAAQLADVGATTVPPPQARAELARAEQAFLTPGLGNLYDAAALAGRTFFTPPFADSQGQQLQLLRREGLMPPALDWHEILDIEPIDYWGPQPQVMAAIGRAVAALGSSPAAQSRLGAEVCARVAAGPAEQPLRGLLERFGADDGRQVAQSINQRLAGHSVPHAISGEPTWGHTTTP
ncbi:MAG: hypothetical protein EOO40_01035 [Deltaproteobacteria bacterium]|nr:MAG: hypothetical protein EOO40_01035 [Deltaproteobacteria bacterium]